MSAIGGYARGGKIAIQAADLDSPRIDGTRNYILSLLKEFGKIAPEDHLLIYHKNKFNSELTPPLLPNYEIKKLRWPFFWTQIRFAGALWKDEPDCLWMPFHNIPLAKPKKVKTTITIHDLAFKYFPDHFTFWDLKKLNFLADMAINHADKIIAISEATKKDILKFYPQIKSEKIKVIYHGYNDDFSKIISPEESEKILKSYNLQPLTYILYVGALQPRKNLSTLIEAFNHIKKERSEIKLVLAGEKAWLWEGILEKVEQSPFKDDIILTGQVSQKELITLYREAALFVFPSLYEGFGLPILEAFTSRVPVLAANNSSLPEVGGDAALYFDALNPADLKQKMLSVLSSEEIRNSMIDKGLQQLQKFSWAKCAKETLEWIKK